MPERSARVPFRPGTGARPPYLAGRGEEQKLLREYLCDLDACLAPGTFVVLYGPRGNGKTALLGWLEREAGRSFGAATSVVLPTQIPDGRSLVTRIRRTRWYDRLTSGTIAGVGLSWQANEPPAAATERVLTARARTKPLLLLLDEAHRLRPEAGEALLTAAQRVSAELPFLLVLAGTPNLRPHLGTLGASLWSRAEKIRLGRLDPTGAAEGFREPFRKAGIPVDSAALDRMVRQSQGYPYFVQLLGRAVWRRIPVRSPGRRVTPEVVEAALPEFHRQEDDYYLDRFEEFERLRLLSVASVVADAFADRQVLSAAQFDEAIRTGLGGLTDAARLGRAHAELRNLGFVWRVRGRPDWEPGIPSLMDYVREHVGRSR